MSNRFSNQVPAFISSGSNTERSDTLALTANIVVLLIYDMLNILTKPLDLVCHEDTGHSATDGQHSQLSVVWVVVGGISWDIIARGTRSAIIEALSSSYSVEVWCHIVKIKNRMWEAM